MIRKLIKFLLFILIILILIISYLSFFGIKTERFNNKIKTEIIKFNKKVNLELKSVKFILNPINLSINIKTFEPEVLIDNNKMEFKFIKTNISLKSFIKNELLIDDLHISTKDVKLNSVVLLTRSFKNSAALFILDKMIKEGSLSADINLNFDESGKVKNDYKINGFIKNGKLGLPNKQNLNDLNLFFQIKDKQYLLKDIEVNFNKIKFTSPLINIKQKKDLFFINGKFINKEENFDLKLLGSLLGDGFKYFNLKKINFNSDSDFNFTINKKFKIRDVNLVSKINLDKLNYKNKLLNLKKYVPNFKEAINLENHEILIDYNKNQFDINGKGKLIIEGNIDTVNYKITKKKNQYIFDTNLNINKNSLLLNILDYKKKEDLQSSLKLNGIYKKDNGIKFNLISLNESDNTFLIKGLHLNNKLKILDLSLLELNYLNNNKIKNQIQFKKDKNNYKINGKSLDATKLINKILNSEDEDLSIFHDLNSIVDIKINRTYLDSFTYINNLSGNINFKNNKVYKLNLDSKFPNNKELVLTINTNENNEKITTLFSSYPKPLLKQYKFIKGFEEGVLDFYSVKKNNVSNSLLVIDNFKVQEVPVLAKLLSLASLQGIADLLTGEGIRFTDFEMKFSNKKGLMKIEEMYAIGPAISILMDGYIESKKLVSLRGTLVPATTIHRTIASIPLIGDILVGKKTGDGVFGVSFKIKGPPKDLKTTVNPVKTLTPRFITRTLEKIKKN